MKAVRSRLLLLAFLVGSLFAVQASGVSAQIPEPPGSEPTPQPTETAGEAGPAPTPSPDPPQLTPEPAPEVSIAPEAPSTAGEGETATDAPTLAEVVQEAAATIQEISPSASAEVSVAEKESAAEKDSQIVEPISEVASKVEETIEEAGEEEEILSGEAATGHREGGPASLSRAMTTEALETWARTADGIFPSAGSIFGSSQPSFAILVDAMNDADGDGIFTDTEIAPAPAGDVRFRALVSNIGSTSFEITEVVHTYQSATGQVQVRVCEKLSGAIVASGESMPCTFSLAEYAPPRGESAVNTVTAAAFEVGNSGRGASDSDVSTVDTLLEGEVLAVAVKREPGLLAFTGIDALGLLILALVLLGAGGTLNYVSRRRRTHQERSAIRDDPWLELLLWLRAELAKSPTRETAGSR